MSPHQILNIRPSSDYQAVRVAYEREMAEAVAAGDGIRQLDLADAYQTLAGAFEAAAAEQRAVEHAAEQGAQALQLHHRHAHTHDHHHMHRYDGGSFIASLFDGMGQDGIVKWTLVALTAVTTLGMLAPLILAAR